MGYQGEWVDGQWQGYGHVTTLEGTIYLGQFEANQKHGYLVAIYRDGAKYQGNWVDGK